MYKICFTADEFTLSELEVLRKQFTGEKLQNMTFSREGFEAFLDFLYDHEEDIKLGGTVLYRQKHVMEFI